MLIVIFGASGRVGQLAVGEALRRGYSVRAIYHTTKPSILDNQELQHLQVNIADADAVNKVIQGTDAVISVLGSWGTSSKDIVSTGTKHFIPAMQAHGITRIISLTGSEALDNTDKPALLRNITHTAASLFAKKILYDGEEHIRLLRASDLDWTVIRSPVMTARQQRGYKLSLTAPKPWQTVSRQAVAKAVIDQLDGPAYSKTAPFIYNQ